MSAERIIHEVRNSAIPHEGNSNDKRVTISIGVTTGEVKHNMFGVKDFIHRADEMLYESKRNGRNRYTFAKL
jgi:diguanylate cyclase (GGDEF)-like protein